MLELNFDEEELSNSEYHKLKALGSTNIKEILKSPYKFSQGIRMEQTKAMAIGSLIHCMVLEPHKVKDEFFIKEKVTLDNAIDRIGKTQVSMEDYATAKACAESIMAQVGDLFTGGVAEKPFFSNFDGVDVKCKPDYYIEEIGLVIDIKKCQDASPDGFQKDAAKYGYFISAPFYIDVLKSLGHSADRFLFVCVEEKFPHMVAVYEYDFTALDFGRKEYHRALDIYKRIDQYKDPIYRDTKDSTTVVQTITIPSWVMYQNNTSY